jgi:hypothetical protein
MDFLDRGRFNHGYIENQFQLAGTQLVFVVAAGAQTFRELLRGFLDLGSSGWGFLDVSLLIMVIYIFYSFD